VRYGIMSIETVLDVLNQQVDAEITKLQSMKKGAQLLAQMLREAEERERNRETKQHSESSPP